MKKLVLILIPVVLLGCSSSMQQTWDNFRAHYNTYYHAKQYFRAGLKSVEDQPVTINPLQPIRVHPAPNGAGVEDFSKTIEKGIRLIRKFPNTKWVDEAVFLIGKSYYYRREFYQALRKFEELYALNPVSSLKQKAVIWKGRTLLDMNRHREAINYLENELTILKEMWTPQLKAEAKVLLGQHYAMVSNWELAADYLGTAVQHINNKPFLGRTYFLYGQALEKLGRYGEAYFTYDLVSSNHPDYEYIYRAELNKGKMARTEGNSDLALSVFESMKRDDKNFERQEEINYELALTKELQGEIKTAEQMYNQMLHASGSLPSRNMQARIYYRLGKIYSEVNQNFKIAAAYYDSLSAYISGSMQITGVDQSVRTLAAAFNSYVALKNEISHIDSLLWLGTLTSSKLDSVIQKRRAITKRKLQEQAIDRSLDNVLTHTDSTEETVDHNASNYGFLNYRNPNIMAASKNKFRAVWGRRPLVDNWRRIGFLSGMTGEISKKTVEQGMLPLNPDQQDKYLGIDLTEIPVTKVAKKKLHREKAQVLYKLGNLFFITLNMPDSAGYYFKKVVYDYPHSKTEARSMYALFEMYKLLETPDSSAYWGNRLTKSYPHSRYARRTKRRVDTEAKVDSETRAVAKLLAEVRSVEAAADTVSALDRAHRYRALALTHRSLKPAEAVYRRAIEHYIHWAKRHTNRDGYTQFLISGSDSTKIKDGDAGAVAQSLFTGQHWDRVRRALDEYHEVFKHASPNRQVREVEKILNKYNGNKKKAPIKN